MKNKGLLVLGLGAIAVIFQSPVLACSVSNWASTSGTVVASQPDGMNSTGAAVSVARYEGVCALQVTGSGYVQDNHPGGIKRIIARFNAFTNGSTAATTPTVYEGYSDNGGASPIFRVTFDTDTDTYTLTDLVSATSVNQAGDGGWDSVEVDVQYGAGSGSVSISVNGAAPTTTGSLSNDAGVLSSVRLGMIANGGGDINFDSYVSHRTTPIGRVCRCNPDGDAGDVVNIVDIFSVVAEAGGSSLNNGTPDCSEDGVVNIVDIFQTVNLAGTTGTCDTNPAP